MERQFKQARPNSSYPNLATYGYETLEKSLILPQSLLLNLQKERNSNVFLPEYLLCDAKIQL